MENKFYIGTVYHKRRIPKFEYSEKLVLYTNDNRHYIDLINEIVYTTNNSNKDYVVAQTLMPTDISEHRIDYTYLLSKYNSKKFIRTKKTKY